MLASWQIAGSPSTWLSPAQNVPHARCGTEREQGFYIPQKAVLPDLSQDSDLVACSELFELVPLSPPVVLLHKAQVGSLPLGLVE